MKILVLGGGQLARMMYLAGCPLGMHVRAVDTNKHQVINAISKTPSKSSLQEAIADADVITAEFEHIPEDLLELTHASGKLVPSIESILTGADRVREKQLLQRLNVANAPHQIITDVEQIPQAIAELGDKLILKSSRDGYDGYGQWRLSSPEQVPALQQELSKLDLKSVPIVAEKMLPFDRELSLIGVRGKQGDVHFYPLVENHHHEGQLHLTLAPAQQLSDTLIHQAHQAFGRIADALDYVGVLAVEFFQMGEQLLVNELAPRVHNSGHWSLTGADTCQFENHLRAVTGLPIGDTSIRTTSAMVNIIGVSSFSREMLAIPGCHLHWYGKTVRPKRKMGHFNMNAKDYNELGGRLLELADHLPEDHFPLLRSEAKRLQAE